MALIDYLGYDGFANGAEVISTTNWTGAAPTLVARSVFGVPGEQWAAHTGNFDRLITLSEPVPGNNARELELSWVCRSETTSGNASDFPFIIDIDGIDLVFFGFETDPLTGINNMLNVQLTGGLGSAPIAPITAGAMFYITVKMVSQSGPGASPNPDGQVVVLVNGAEVLNVSGITWGVTQARRVWDNGATIQFRATASGLESKSMQIRDGFEGALITDVPDYIYVGDPSPTAFDNDGGNWTGAVADVNDNDDNTAVSTLVSSSPGVLSFTPAAALAGTTVRDVVVRVRAARQTTAFNDITLAVDDGVVAADSTNVNLAAVAPGTEDINYVFNSATGWDADNLQLTITNGA